MTCTEMDAKGSREKAKFEAIMNVERTFQVKFQDLAERNFSGSGIHSADTRMGIASEHGTMRKERWQVDIRDKKPGSARQFLDQDARAICRSTNIGLGGAVTQSSSQSEYSAAMSERILQQESKAQALHNSELKGQTENMRNKWARGRVAWLCRLLASVRGATGAATDESGTAQDGARNSQTRTQLLAQGLQWERREKWYDTKPKQPKRKQNRKGTGGRNPVQAILSTVLTRKHGSRARLCLAYHLIYPYLSKKKLNSLRNPLVWCPALHNLNAQNLPICTPVIIRNVMKNTLVGVLGGDVPGSELLGKR
ncbi:hypothetical protein K438DRAFT_1772295 [Mycena galopus ATCC 62051]|nr:hypothetical protein K438DRAFT_1772295 [Mycena galopus ATCC 62051]